MRKALIAIITAAVLFAVGAFAADLTVNTQNVASGNADVGSCASEATVSDWAVAFSQTAEDWTTNAATVTLEPKATGSCNDPNVSVELAINSDGTWSEHSCSGSNVSWNCGINDLPVNPIIEVAVLVNGDTFSVPAP